MEKFLGLEYADLDARKSFLKDNCDVVEEVGYMKPFSPEEVTEMKNELAEISIEINDIEEEKKSNAELFKIKLKPLLDNKAELLTGIKNQSEYTKEICYTFIDQDQKMVGSYNSDGMLISQRPAMPKELQGTIHQMMRKTGTND